MTKVAACKERVNSTSQLRLLITFANSLYPHFVRPDLDPNCLTLLIDTLIVFLSELFEKLILKNKQ